MMNCFQLWMLNFMQNTAKKWFRCFEVKSISERTLMLQFPGNDSRLNGPDKIYPEAKHSDPFLKEWERCYLRTFDCIINV